MGVRRKVLCLLVIVAVLAAATPVARLLATDPQTTTSSTETQPPAELLNGTIPLSGPIQATFVATEITEVAKTPVTPCILVNNRRIRLNYQISDVGPSGVSAVELWATRDGKAWQRYSNEPPPVGPLVVHVTEEGKYGFHLVVKNGVGVTSPAPVPGDAPQLWVDVDESCPVVRLRDVTLGTGTEHGMLNISWSAHDANLTYRPVTILTGASKDGPWTPIATNQYAKGNYTWRIPRRTAYQIHVRVEATDKAGNVGAATLSDPIRVDFVRPRGTILGVDMGTKTEIVTEVVPVNPVSGTTAPVVPPEYQVPPIKGPETPN